MKFENSSVVHPHSSIRILSKVMSTAQHHLESSDSSRVCVTTSLWKGGQRQRRPPGCVKMEGKRRRKVGGKERRNEGRERGGGKEEEKRREGMKGKRKREGRNEKRKGGEKEGMKGGKRGE